MKFGSKRIKHPFLPLVLVSSKDKGRPHEEGVYNARVSNRWTFGITASLSDLKRVQRRIDKCLAGWLTFSSNFRKTQLSYTSSIYLPKRKRQKARGEAVIYRSLCCVPTFPLSR